MKFYIKYRSRIMVTIVTIILFVIIGVTSLDRSDLSFIENKVGNFILPIQKLFFNIGNSIANTFSSITTFSQMKYENIMLKDEILKLEKENRQMLDVISRTEYLRNEYILKKNLDLNVVDSKIIAKDPGNWFNRFVIDKGKKDGISKGDVVITAVKIDNDIIETGLVGKVDIVGDNWSKVISIIDKGSNVSFKVVRTQDKGIISGNLNDLLNGYMFDENAEVVKGYKIVTSGLGEVYEPDIYIGEIVNVVKEDDELLKKIAVKPAVNFKKLDEVFVIKR